MTKVKSEEANVRISQELCIRESLQSIVTYCEMLIYRDSAKLSSKNLYYLKSLSAHVRELVKQKDSYLKSMYDFYEITEIYRLDEI